MFMSELVHHQSDINCACLFQIRKLCWRQAVRNMATQCKFLSGTTQNYFPKCK